MKALAYSLVTRVVSGIAGGRCGSVTVHSASQDGLLQHAHGPRQWMSEM